MKIMKKLSDFKDEKGIVVASQILSVIMEILADKKNLEQSGKSPAVMFGEFMKNCPVEMKKIFAILSEEDPESYHCDGTEAIMNMMVLANDPVILSLFISQGQTGDAKSSASVLENTEE
jgi:hypothetical protein